MRRAARPALVLLALAACGPKVSTTPTTYDEELGKPAPAAAPVPDEARPEVPPGKGLRTGVIARDRLIAVLDAGPATFLRQLEVAPHMRGERFVGWQLVQLVDHAGPLHDVDVLPGDVLLALNGQALARPDQLQTVWDSLRGANEVAAQLWRGDGKFTIAFTIEPALPPGTVVPPPARAKR